MADGSDSANGVNGKANGNANGSNGDLTGYK